MMKCFFLFVLIFSLSAEAKLRRGLMDVRKREPRDTKNTVRMNDTELNDGLFGNSKVTFKLGPDFQRYDLENLSQEKNSFYSIDGLNFQFTYDYWFSHWLIFKHNTSFSRYQLRRYDGVAINNEDKKQYSFSYGAELVLVNFYLGYQLAKERRTWMYESRLGFVDETRLKTNAHKFEVGYRLYIYKPVAIDFFYRYSLLSNRAETQVGEVSGKEVSFGFRAFWNKAEETQYGIEFNEVITNTSWGTGTLRNKTFQMLPFISF